MLVRLHASKVRSAAKNTLGSFKSDMDSSIAKKVETWFLFSRIPEFFEPLFTDSKVVSDFVNYRQLDFLLQFLDGPAHGLQRLLEYENRIRIERGIRHGLVHKRDARKKAEKLLPWWNLHLLQHFL